MKFNLLTVLTLIAVISIGGTIGYVTSNQRSSALRQPYRTPPTAPPGQHVAGAGVVEAASENIRVGTFVPGIVVEVAVTPGQKVKKGDVLFKLDSRQAEADLALHTAMATVSEKQLAELRALPRIEDVQVAVAKVSSAEALVEQQNKKLERTKQLNKQNATSADDLDAAVEAAAVAIEGLINSTL